MTRSARPVSRGLLRCLEVSPQPVGSSDPSATPVHVLRLRNSTWWLHPGWTVLMATVPGFLVAWSVTDELFRRWWHSPKLLRGDDILLAAVLLGAFTAGTMVPFMVRRPATGGGELTVTSEQRELLRRAGLLFFSLTLAGYLAWMTVAVARGFSLSELLDVVNMRPDAVYTTKRLLAPVSGVTTMVQFGPLAMMCLLLHGRLTGPRRQWRLAVLAVLVLARTVLDTERLSLIELLMPAVVLSASILPPRECASRSWLWAAAPLAAPAGLGLIFGTFEYMRSWITFYSQHGNVGYGVFVVRRIAGYYATACNNSVILLGHLGPVMPLPYFTVKFLWNLPLVSALLPKPDLLGFDPDTAWDAVLHQYGNPEFNSPGGILPVVADFGVAGAALWLGVVGLLIGLTYRWLRAGEVRGLVLYAVVYVGLVDLTRLFYWGEGRAFPPIAGGVILAALLHRRRAAVPT